MMLTEGAPAQPGGERVYVGALVGAALETILGLESGVGYGNRLRGRRQTRSVVGALVAARAVIAASTAILTAALYAGPKLEKAAAATGMDSEGGDDGG